MRLSQFVPKSDSKVVFIVAMVCYTWTLASLVGALVRAFHLTPPPPGLFAIHGDSLARICDLVLFAPLIETLILVSTIELARWLRSPVWLQVAAGAAVIAILHCFPWRARGLIVAPAFAIDAAAYLYWRSASKKIAFTIVACIHALHNAILAISIAAYATRHA